MRKALVIPIVLLMIGTFTLMLASSNVLDTSNWLNSQASTTFSSNLNSEIERGETITLGYAGLLTVNNQLGKVYIEGDDTTDVTLKIVKRAKATLTSAAHLLDQITVETAASNGRTQVVARVPQTRDGEEVSVDLHLIVPRELVADLKLNLGALEIKDVSGTLRIDNDLGSVKISNFQGNAFIQADLGSVEIVDAAFSDNLHVVASMGKVEISGSLARSSIIENRLGGVQLFLTPDEAYELEANVDLGSFDLTVPFTGEHTQSSAMGTIGSGDPRGKLSLIISLGSLRIDYL